MHLEEQSLDEIMANSELLVSCYYIIESAVSYMASDRLVHMLGWVLCCVVGMMLIVGLVGWLLWCLIDIYIFTGYCFLTKGNAGNSTPRSRTASPPSSDSSRNSPSP